MKYTLLLLFVSFAINCNSQAQPNDKTERLNVVLFIADDVSSDFSCFNGQVNTPNIDQLAEYGLRFENAYATASSCSPSRCSIITGRYPHNTGAPELHMELPEGQFMFPKALKEAGYYSVLSGKWHMGEATRPAFDQVYNVKYSDDPTGSARWVQCLQERPMDKPFFMWFASFDAHRPWEPDSLGIPFDPADVILPIGVPDTPKSRKDMASYYDEVQRFDRYVGTVLNKLKEQNVFDNTLIILLGDNGRPFPRNKTSLYDNGMKTPLIVSWPEGKFNSDTVSNSLVSAIDIAPTILQAVDLPIPPQIKGISLLPICRKPENEIHHFIFGERNWPVQRACGRMVRCGNYIYIRDFTPELYSFQIVDHNTGSYAELLRLKAEGNLTTEQAEAFSTNRAEEMLFNVALDSQQLVNLVNNPAYKEELKYLRTILLTWQSSTGDSLTLVEEMTPDRYDRNTFERLFLESHPPTGVIPGQKAGDTSILKKYIGQ